jgi:hypothetical protein
VATIPIGGACEFQSLEGRYHLLVFHCIWQYHAVNHDRRFLVVSSCAQRDVSYANDWIAALMLLRLVDKFPERKPRNHKSRRVSRSDADRSFRKLLRTKFGGRKGSMQVPVWWER